MIKYPYHEIRMELDKLRKNSMVSEFLLLLQNLVENVRIRALEIKTPRWSSIVPHRSTTAVAVLAVCVFHWNHRGLPGGFVGVDISL